MNMTAEEGTDSASPLDEVIADIRQELVRRVLGQTAIPIETSTTLSKQNSASLELLSQPFNADNSPLRTRFCPS
jgi:hypothetical protein